MIDRAVNVSLPLCLCLADGGTGEGADGLAAVRLALDRRASCVIRSHQPGFLFESRDSGEKAEARTLGELAARASGPLAAVVVELLRELEVEEGVRVTTHCPVPGASGLPILPTLGLATACAVASYQARRLPPDELSRISTEVVRRLAPSFCEATDSWLAPFAGGAHLVEAPAPTLRWRSVCADPARMEECLLLVDPGSAEAGGERTGGIGRELPGRMVAALEAGQMEEVTRLLDEDWQRGGAAGPAVQRLADLAREAGGAIRRCSPRGEGLVLAWAVPGARGPGARERLLESLRREGLRTLAVRVDLLGLEAEG